MKRKTFQNRILYIFFTNTEFSEPVTKYNNGDKINETDKIYYGVATQSGHWEPKLYQKQRTKSSKKQTNNSNDDNDNKALKKASSIWGQWGVTISTTTAITESKNDEIDNNSTDEYGSDEGSIDNASICDKNASANETNSKCDI